MAVRIGHASIGDKGKVKGGTAGDQTGREVCIRSWYNGKWGFLARAREAEVAEKIAAACEAGCANGNIGYDQNQRNTLNKRAKQVGYDLSKIDIPCETDCSAFVSVCVQAAGVEVPCSGGNAPTTSTLKTVLRETGAFDIYTAGCYLTGSAYLRRGDILVRPGKHTVMVLDDGEKADESNLCLPLLTKGSYGATVRTVQLLLGGLNLDSSFGSATEVAVKSFQKANDLTADGEVGRKTWAKLLGIG